MGTTVARTRTPAPETDWDAAPELLEGAQTLQLDAHMCNLEYWLTNVAQGTLTGLVHGHRPTATVPPHMLEPGPLREAVITEMAFRSIAEEKATRSICSLVAHAPDVDTMEFFATQLVDEARHSRVFAGHIVELGVDEAELPAVVERVAGADRDAILQPLEDYAKPILDRGDFIAGVVMLTVLVEGVLAPAAELSERKWRPLDPAVADIERGAGIDEIRHLTVGSAVVREHLQRNPQETDRLVEFIRAGRALWDKLPVPDVLMRREHMFQQGLAAHADVVGDYEIWPQRRLIDTTPEERVYVAAEWTAKMQQTRLAYMGLSAALG
jgi:hypothetical protein